MARNRFFLFFVIPFLLPAILHAAADKELSGVISEVNPGDAGAEIRVIDFNKEEVAVQVPADTKLTRQIRFEDIREGEYAAVLFEDKEGKAVALSTTVGSKEQVEKQKKSEELAVPQEAMKAPAAPAMPQMPSMPPLPGAEGAPPPPQGAEGGQGKQEEATGFSPEEAEKAKKEKDKPKDILSPESPLSPVGKGEAVPPDFALGKVISAGSASGTGNLLLETSSGEQMALEVPLRVQVVNRILELKDLRSGNAVTVFYEDKEDSKFARSIIIAPPPKTPPEA